MTTTTPDTSMRSQRLVLGSLLAALVVGGLLAFWLVNRGDDEPQTVATEEEQSDQEQAGDEQPDESAAPPVGQAGSIAAAAQAQARRESAIASAQGAGGGDDAAASDAETVEPADEIGIDVAVPAADTSSFYECGGWEPSDEDLAMQEQENADFSAHLTLFGVEHETITDELGFSYVEYDYEDFIAEVVANSFWENRYPAEPIPEEELALIRAENDGLAAAFDAAGIAYERMSEEEGWEWIEWDYEDAAAQQVADAYYVELYPPEPIDPEFLEQIRAENDGLAAAFDAAGIAYERMTDTEGYEWIEYDWDDPAANEVVEAYYQELYPPLDCDGNPLSEEELIEFESEFAEEHYVPSEEELAEIRAEADGLAAAFDAAGIAYERITEEDGWEWIEFDYEDDAANLIADEYYSELHGPDPDFLADRSAAATALQTAFDAAGVTYSIDGEDDWVWMTFDSDNPAAPGAVAEARAALA